MKARSKMQKINFNRIKTALCGLLFIALLVSSLPIAHAEIFEKAVQPTITDTDTAPVISPDTSTINDFLDSKGDLKENFGHIFDEKVNPVNRANPKKISLNSSNISLYITFEDQKLAMENIKKLVPNYIKYLKDTYNLNELSDSTFPQYALHSNTAAYVTPESNIFDSFVDIYENVECNREIQKLVLTNKDPSSVDFLTKINAIIPRYKQGIYRGVHTNSGK